MTRYDLEIEDSCRAIDLELGNIKRKIMEKGFESAIIELTPFARDCQATISFFDRKQPDGSKPMFSVDVTHDGNLSPVRCDDRRAEFI